MLLHYFPLKTQNNTSNILPSWFKPLSSPSLSEPFSKSSISASLPSFRHMINNYTLSTNEDIANNTVLSKLTASESCRIPLNCLEKECEENHNNKQTYHQFHQQN